MDPGSAIVIISSMAGQRTGTNPTYETSKAAQVALARAIANAGEPNGIRANVIAPVSSLTDNGAFLSGLSQEN